jgi:hypothetical protein
MLGGLILGGLALAAWGARELQQRRRASQRLLAT